MDKVYTLTMKVRHEGSLLLGIYKTREGAEDAAMVWSSGMYSSLEICEEEVLP